MTGELTIITRETLPEEFVGRIDQAAAVLSSQGIAVSRGLNPSGSDPDLIIQVIQMGDISHEEIKPFLLALFPKERGIKGLSAILRDCEEDKVFELPRDFGECIDWFRIE